MHNYDDKGFGKLDLVDATVHSVNTVYAQLMLDVGPQYAVATGAPARRAVEARSRYPGAVLGSTTT